jgi:hypothetical protein
MVRLWKEEEQGIRTGSFDANIDDPTFPLLPHIFLRQFLFRYGQSIQIRQSYTTMLMSVQNTDVRGCYFYDDCLWEMWDITIRNIVAEDSPEKGLV